MKRVLPVVLLCLMILGASIAIRDADPVVRRARESRLQAVAAREWAKTERTRALTTTVVNISDEINGMTPVIASAVTLAGLAVLATGVVVLAGVAVAVIVYVNLRAQIGGRALRADRRGIYPVVAEPGGGWTALNEPRAQTLAAMMAASARRPTAAMVRRALDTPYAEELPPPTHAPTAPATNTDAGRWPTLIEVYSAPKPRQLALPVGVDGKGNPVTLPLHNLGNVLIGGLPGTGKSELMAAMIAGLLRQDASGERVQVAVIDPKMVDFGNIPPDLPALWQPVVTEMDEAHRLLEALQEEVRRRFELMHTEGVRSLHEYNEHGQQMPYLLLFVDELADMTCDVRYRASQFVHAAMEIGRKGRAAGVSLVMATQRPSADVVPASLRNLAGAAVAFRVQRNHDSIAILSEPGAEQLPPLPGRCLVRYANTLVCQAYSGGLATRRFDAFLAALPRSSSVPDDAGISVWEGGIDGTGTSGIGTNDTGTPVFSDSDRSAYTPEQVAYIRTLYARYRSIKAVERVLYGQDGGYWFYRLQEVLKDG